MAEVNARDLTKQPPRSPRVRLGGFVLLPRMLDKCRALIQGTQGEYNYACPMDQHFLEFTGIDPEALKREVASAKGDCEILKWVEENCRPRRTASEIYAWSVYMEQRPPGEVEGRDFFHETHRQIAPAREDIGTWFDLLDLDDYVSFGGRP